MIINTDTRWCDYSFWQEYDERFVFEERDEDGFTHKIYSFEVDFEAGVRYSLIANQEKDQTYFYFIPFDMLNKEK